MITQLQVLHFRPIINMLLQVLFCVIKLKIFFIKINFYLFFNSLKKNKSYIYVLIITKKHLLKITYSRFFFFIILIFLNKFYLIK